ncbi:E3 ubiquitin-protein ligase RNF4 isoform X4 [Onychostruthus taczanowskii]|uniref:E3 ubiquitin-protein ligase RNF4 isoform X4 n=1 Tax=Onychostruthus taczanowskii TaxID=356909 RepID=UPI001B80DA48|nr:E3 ubiquitin-protein ligase RNF4 isoform X4 [Onychostruthus taczanowskii]
MSRWQGIPEYPSRHIVVFFLVPPPCPLTPSSALCWTGGNCTTGRLQDGTFSTLSGLEEHHPLIFRNLELLSVSYLKESKGIVAAASLPLLFWCLYLFVSGFRSRNTMSTTQRKRRGGTVNSRQARKRSRLMASTAEMASEAEPIELEESAGEEVVDLTCESSDPVVVDLTHNDSIVRTSDKGEI